MTATAPVRRKKATRIKRRFLAFALAGFVALPAIAAPADDARRLRIEAAALVRAAAKAGSAQERHDLLRKAAGKLADLRKRYPSEPSRLRLYLGGKRVSLSSDDMLAEERAAIRRAEEKRRAAARKAEEKKRAAARKAEEIKRLAALKAERARLTRLWPAGKQFRDCADCPQMVVIPAGSFTMGSPPNERYRSGDEGPQHRVTIWRPFAVGRYEVTFAQWDACVSAGGCRHRPNDRGWGRGPRPVMSVSWRDAKAYVGWLSRKTGKRYRLLSEAEWEYAARAGTTGPFHFGSTISTDRANYNGTDTYGSGRKGIYRRKTVPVGRFPANAFGLHDMHGNVWEWVEDCSHKSYRGAPADGRPWTAGGNCSRRVLRGGSWVNVPRYLRAAFRSRLTAGNRDGYVGFRIARTLTP